jgi:cell division protein FtsZ
MEELNFEIAEEVDIPAGTRIKVIGIGGAGCNAVARMMAEGVKGVEFYALNTDRQALMASPIPNKLVIGTKLTRGLGAGSDPQVGRQAAEEDSDRITEILEGAHMVFITCGLGGGTGTGAAPVVASFAKGLDALTVAVVTKPFQFEGSRRQKIASEGLAELAANVDTIITVPNEKLLAVAGKGTSFVEAYRTADDVLRQAVQGISDIINTPGLVNRDFADIRAIMAGMGYATMGTAVAGGENAAKDAAKAACSGVLMDQKSIEGAAGLLINIAGSSSLGLHDVHEACSMISAETKNEDVRVNFGVVIDDSLKDQVKVTVIATGFGKPGEEKAAFLRSSPISGLAISNNYPAVHAAEVVPVEQVGVQDWDAAVSPLTMSDLEPEFTLPSEVLADRPEPEFLQNSDQSAANAAGQANVDPHDLNQPAFFRRKLFR